MPPPRNNFVVAAKGYSSMAVSQIQGLIQKEGGGLLGTRPLHVR